jgi:hypothetical protein
MAQPLMGRGAVGHGVAANECVMMEWARTMNGHATLRLVDKHEGTGGRISTREWEILFFCLGPVPGEPHLDRSH